MTFDEMVQFVRLQADADATDMPDTALTLWARMGYNDIIARVPYWSHLQVNYTFTTVPGQSEYLFTSFSVPDMERVSSVVDQNEIGRRLQFITRADSDLLYAGNNALLQADPLFYLIENKRVVLFPVPDQAKQYVVRGQRMISPWPNGAGSSPDLPEFLHESVCYFMLAQYYLSQEDTEVYQVYLGEYERRVEQFVRYNSKRESSSRPATMGGGVRRLGFLDRVKGVLEG